jgi:hypothetical protein
MRFSAGATAKCVTERDGLNRSSPAGRRGQRPGANKDLRRADLGVWRLFRGAVAAVRW